MKINKIALIILVLVTSGCSSVDNPTATHSDSPQTLTFTPIPTHTLSPIPTHQVKEGVTLPNPTPFLVRTKFSKACQDEYYEEYTKISPNGEWLAESCFTNGTMQISNQDGTKIIVVDNKDYFNDPLFPELSGSVTPVHWTKDSCFIYFTVTPEQWNDGAYLVLDSFAPLLRRMNIKSGETTDVLSGKFYHSFSPTDRRLIEVQEFEHPVTLIVHDLQTGLSQTLIPDNNSKYGQAVRVVWSPDGLKFVFIAAFGGEYGDEVSEPNVQSLILVDLNDLSQQIILSETPDFIKPVSWDENDIIAYQITSYDDRSQITTYTYDYRNDEFNVLPTVTP